MDNVLDIQIGGSHYKNFKMQPIELIVKAKCDFIQGCIIKYVSRYKDKNGKQDIQKCIHYSQIAIELLPDEKRYSNLGLGYSYIKANSLSKYQSDIIIATLQCDYLSVIRSCKALIKSEY